MAVAIGILLLIVITLLFHFFSPWWFTEIAADWSAIDLTVDITFIVTGIVFIILNAFLVWVIIRYRNRPGIKAHYEPESKKLEWWLTIITTIGVISLLAPGLWVWDRIVSVPDDAATVEVIGQQWHWSYRFPGEDGVLGQVDIALMTVENPFGMKPDDPAGMDDILIDNPELHLPVDTTYKFLLRSKDVLHNFTVPQFRVKMDLIPGMTPYIWATPNRMGRFDVLCEELCGIAHFAMRGVVVIEQKADFEAWLSNYPSFADVLQRPAPDLVAGQTQYAVCSACHGANGEGNVALNAPKIAGQEAWYLERQIENFKHGLRGTDSNDTFGAQMAPMAAMLANESAISNVAAYITTLPDLDSPSTVTGDVSRGEEIFTTCKSCHGSEGQGIWALNAPRLKDGSDWYFVRQLENYKTGVRGSHPQDLYGKQMSLLTIMLRDEQAVNDVVAYINTL